MCYGDALPGGKPGGAMPGGIPGGIPGGMPGGMPGGIPGRKPGGGTAVRSQTTSKWQRYRCCETHFLEEA